MSDDWGLMENWDESGPGITDEQLACQHEWHEEYYGSRCSKCDLFYPDGCAPWDWPLEDYEAVEADNNYDANDGTEGGG